MALSATLRHGKLLTGHLELNFPFWFQVHVSVVFTWSNKFLFKTKAVTVKMKSKEEWEITQEEGITVGFL